MASSGFPILGGVFWAVRFGWRVLRISAVWNRRNGFFVRQPFVFAGRLPIASKLLVALAFLSAAAGADVPQPHLASVHAKVVPLNSVRNGWVPVLQVGAYSGASSSAGSSAGAGAGSSAGAGADAGSSSEASAGSGGAPGFRANGEWSGAPDGNRPAIVSKFAEESAPIASVTKLMTALVVLESGAPLNEWLVMPERKDKPPKNAWSRIRVDSRATREDLLRITLMASENYAAYALARHHPGGMEQFVADMNARAAELGMRDTRFHDPAGLWVENVSTATDLVRLLVEANEHREIREMSTTTWHRVNFRGPQYHLDFGNTNPLLHNERWSISLSKTGYLEEAGRCLVMVADLGGEPTAIVLLDSFGQRSPIGDAGRIRRWVESGAVGTVAGAAAEYERERAARFRISSISD